MALAIELEVGPQAVGAADGTGIASRAGRTGEQIITELNPRYFEQALRGKSFSAMNQAAQALSVGLATTYTGALLYNPVGSGKILIPTKVKFAISATPGATLTTLGLLTGFSATGGVTAQTTKLTVQNNAIGNTSAGVGICLSAATIVTPTFLMSFYDAFTASTLYNPTPPIDLEGQYIILPGGFIGLTSTLAALTGYGSIAWFEVDYTS